MTDIGTTPRKAMGQMRRRKKRKVCCPSCLHPGIKLDRKTADKRLRFVCDKCGNWWTEGKL